jgi:transcription initiation factor TFIIIB Brf1 subunit/transcription initiation factor TFIIB
MTMIDFSDNTIRLWKERQKWAEAYLGNVAHCYPEYKNLIERLKIETSVQETMNIIRKKLDKISPTRKDSRLEKWLNTDFSEKG